MKFTGVLRTVIKMMFMNRTQRQRNGTGGQKQHDKSITIPQHTSYTKAQDGGESENFGLFFMFFHILKM